MRGRAKLVYVSLAVGLVVVSGIAYLMLPARVSEEVTARDEAEPTPNISPTVTIGETKISVELATTSAAIERGLSGRLSLAKDAGMLFIFKQPDRYRFWMPEMNFPLDILWIEAGEVKDISTEVSNAFDPLHPVFYRPSVPVRYVLEVNAGFIKRSHISIGDRVTFSYIQ